MMLGRTQVDRIRLAKQSDFKLQYIRFLHLLQEFQVLSPLADSVSSDHLQATAANLLFPLCLGVV